MLFNLPIMKMKYFALSLLTSCVLIFTSCSSDDGNGGDAYVPIVINTQPDFAEVFQNAQLEINVFANDSDVPGSGTLSIGTPGSGTAEVLDPNNTPDNVLDDRVRYTPESTFSGETTFRYTICDEEGRSCASETVSINVLPFSPVNFDINAVPYNSLSDYNFFEGPMADQMPVYGVLPYEPISGLFTDYAKKSRYVWMPYEVQAEFNGDGNIMEFPVGTVLIKTFYYNDVLPGMNQQIIETRLMINKPEGWIFADYIWNEAQTEAALDVNGQGGFVEIDWLENGDPKSVNYRIPATSECLTCHKNFGDAIPIGVKPQNLNSQFSYEDGTANQLEKWIDMGYLADNLPADINTVVAWDDTSQSLELRVRSYMDINCASCHTDGGHCDYRPLRLAFEDSADEVNMGVCVDPQTPIPEFKNDKLITPGDADNSILFFRMVTTEEQYRMPLLGRTLAHDEGVEMVRQWINSLTTECN